MSQETVNLMLVGHEAFIRRDFDAWVGFADPEIVITSSFMGQEFHGHAGAREWLRELESTLPDFTAEIREIRDLGDVVLVGLVIRGHGVGSDAPFEQFPWVVQEWRNRKCVRSSAFSSEAEALKAVGLSE